MSVGVAGPRLIAKVLDVPPDDAVSVAVCAALTADTVAVKLAVVAPAGTVIDDGTVTAVALLDRLTVKPPLAAAELRLTVQPSVPAAVIELFVQFNPLSTGVVDASV